MCLCSFRYFPRFTGNHDVRTRILMGCNNFNICYRVKLKHFQKFKDTTEALACE